MFCIFGFNMKPYAHSFQAKMIVNYLAIGQIIPDTTTNLKNNENNNKEDNINNIDNKALFN